MMMILLDGDDGSIKASGSAQGEYRGNFKKSNFFLTGTNPLSVVLHGPMYLSNDRYHDVLAKFNYNAGTSSFETEWIFKSDYSGFDRLRTSFTHSDSILYTVMSSIYDDDLLSAIDIKYDLIQLWSMKFPSWPT